MNDPSVTAMHSQLQSALGNLAQAFDNLTPHVPRIARLSDIQGGRVLYVAKNGDTFPKLSNGGNREAL